MHFQWLRTEHHRLHVIEDWPDSPHKQAALAAIRSKLASLARNLPPELHWQDCEICLNRRSPVLAFPVATRLDTDPAADLAA